MNYSLGKERKLTCLHSNRESRGISATRYFLQTRRLATAAGCATQRVTLHWRVSLRLRNTSVYSVHIIRRRFDLSTTSNLYHRPDSLSCDSTPDDPYDESHDILGNLIATLATAYILLLTIKVRLKLVLFSFSYS